MWRLWSALALLLVLTSCDSGNLLVIDLRTDMVPGLEFHQARVELEHDQPEGTYRTATIAIPRSADVVGGLRLTELSNVPSGTVRIRVTLLDDRGNGRLQRLTLTELAGDTAVTVMMTRDCRGITCGDASAEACLGGRCVDARCTPETSDLCPAPPDCAADSECAPGLACTEARCIDGVCFYAALDERCDMGADQVCSPDHGCIPYVPLGEDASRSMDGSMMDGGAGDGAITDTMVGDAGEGGVDGDAVIDGGPDTWWTMTDADPVDGCVPSPELCNGLDEDCDRVIDEAPSHIDCVREHTTSFCDPGGSGDCTIVSCEAQYDDCDTDPNNGCESELMYSELHCGRCDNPCPGGQYCDGGTCADDRVTGIAAGRDHSCAITLSGLTYCWGNGGGYILGHGSTTGSRTPILNSATDLIEIWSGGALVTCGRNTAGETICWGLANEAELGGGTETVRVPTHQPQLDRFSEIVFGSSFGCGLDGGEVYCWGQNAVGQIGQGTSSGVVSMPTRVMPLSGIVDLTVGDAHACALSGGGQVSCWGWGNNGQLGNGMTVEQTRPVDIVGPMDFTHIEATDDTTCGVRSGGAVFCWGANFNGQYGDGTEVGYAVPAPNPSMIASPNALSGTTSPFMCATSGPTNQVHCWGYNFSGETGTNDPAGEVLVPGVVAGMDDVIDLELGGTHACALRSDGSAWCWGNDSWGQLGDDPAQMNMRSPSRVLGVPGPP